MRPTKLLGERVHLVAFTSADEAELTEVLNRNAAHLGPWMPWAQDLPRSASTNREFLESVAADRANDTDHGFALRRADTGELVGATGLHRRVGPGGIEIGYWLDSGHTGRGLVTEAAAIATAAGFEHFGAMRMEIHVAPDNARSLRVPERLGYTREGLLRARSPWPRGGWRDKVVHSLLASEFPASPAAGVRYRAFDEGGDELRPAAVEPEERL
ncbi:MAG TPA: N-acetyltransferase [Planctomycetes bacterium]|nr:N-acetyltransferase [Planctomycetota bacterium]